MNCNKAQGGVLLSALMLSILILPIFMFSGSSFCHAAEKERDPFEVPRIADEYVPSKHALSSSSEKTASTSVVEASPELAVIPVRYAKPADLLAVIEGGKDSAKRSGLLSEYGQVSVDPGTNALIVRDLPSHLSAIRSMIQALDLPVRQVRIEARIVTVSEGALDEIGVRWGTSVMSGGNGIGGSIEHNLAAVGEHVDSGASQEVTNLLNVNLPGTSANTSAVAFQLATLGSGTLLDLELSALQSESRAEVISSPSLLTTNRQPAFIEQGTEIPYQESNTDGDVSVAFKKAVLSLEVTPNITPDNHLILDLRVTQDRPGEVVKTGTGEAVAITTQRIGTQVLVKDGETVVLGGIYQKTQMHRIDKVPILGDIPLVGRLFRRTYQKNDKSELLIFVTPKVVIQ